MEHDIQTNSIEIKEKKMPRLIKELFGHQSIDYTLVQHTEKASKDITAA